MFINWNLDTVYNDVENFCRKQRMKKSPRHRRQRLGGILSAIVLSVAVSFAGHRLIILLGLGQ